MMSNDFRHLSPEFSMDEVKQIAMEYYYLKEFVCQLPSERDQNFLFQDNQSKFVLKISNIDEKFSIIDMQNCAMQRIGKDPSVVPDVNGKLIISYKNHLIRLVTYLPGIPLADYRPHSEQLLFNLGQVLGNMDQSLIGFEHEASKRDLYWNMINAQRIINNYKHLIEEKNQKDILDNILDEWNQFVIPQFSSLRMSIIHNDANDYNIIVTDQNQLALIDFGDMCQTFLVCEPAIACAYIMLNKDNPIQSAANLIQGYHQIYPLQLIEIHLIYYFIRMRLAMSVTISAHQKQIQPDNQYLVISEKSAWLLLAKLATIDTKFVQHTFRSVCHLSD